MKLLKKLTMMLLAIGMTASFAACDTILGMLNLGGESESTSETSQTSEVEETGEMLSETEFATALQTLYSQTNLLVTITDGEQNVAGKKTLTGVVSFADNKVYSELAYSADGNVSKEYTYVGVVDGVCYEWTSTNSVVWEYKEVDMANTTAGAFLEEVFIWCGFEYCEFNNKTSMMEFTGMGSPSVGVKVVDGKIVGFHFEDIAGNWYAATITYGGAVIGELPSLD